MSNQTQKYSFLDRANADRVVTVSWLLDTFPKTRDLSEDDFHSLLDKFFYALMEKGLLNFKHYTMEEILTEPESYKSFQKLAKR